VDINRAESWEQVKKVMNIWKLPPDFWKATQKVIQFYRYNPDKQKMQEEDEPPIPQTPEPFQPTLNNVGNLLCQAYRAQSAVGWENFMKGRIVGKWENYVASHTRQSHIGLPAKEWAAKLIIALWDYLHRIYNQGRIAR
jgi:hypothetical protein